MLDFLNRFFGLIVATLRQVKSLKIWSVLMIGLGLFWLLLFALDRFYWPVFSGFVGWLVNLINDDASESFSHFPNHYLLLPYYFGWAKYILSLLVQGLILGGTVAVFYRRIVGIDSKAAINRSGRFVLGANLMAAWILIYGLAGLAGIYLPSLFQDVSFASPRVTFAVDYLILPSCFAFIYALFFVLIPSIVILGDNIFRGVGRSLRLFVRNPVTMYSLALIIVLIPNAVSKTSDRTAFVLENFKPEIIFWLLSLTLFVEMLAYFFWMGSATRLLLELEEE